MNRLRDPVTNIQFVSRITWLQFCTLLFLTGFGFSFVAADNFETLVSCTRHLRDFHGECSSLAPVLSSLSSLSTQMFQFFFFFSIMTLRFLIYLQFSDWFLYTSWNLCWNLFLLLQNHFSHWYGTWSLITMCELMWHFDIEIMWLNEWLLIAQVKYINRN